MEMTYIDVSVNVYETALIEHSNFYANKLFLNHKLHSWCKSAYCSLVNWATVIYTSSIIGPKY